MKRAAFLDRDGVLIASNVVLGRPHSETSANSVKVLPGVTEAVKLLKSSNIIVVVITNQPDVSRGKIKMESVKEIHDVIAKETGIEHFYVCPHDDSDLCICRKPLPGMIDRATKDLNICHQSSFLVGDRWRDINLGVDLGIRSYFIDYSYNEVQPLGPYITVSSLLEAATREVRSVE